MSAPATSIAELLEGLPVRAVPLDELHPNPENPRTITDDGMARLVKSLRAAPQMLAARPVVALPDGTIIAGNMRWRAAGELGLDAVPTVYVDLSPEDAKLWLLRDNNEYGEWVEDGLTAMLADLAGAGADLEMTGFDSALLDGLLSPPEDANTNQGDMLAELDVLIAPPQHELTLGEVWTVGRHKLAVASVYTGWPTFGPLLSDGALLVPYPTPILPLTQRARSSVLVMVQPDVWLAGHLLDKYAHAFPGDTVERDA